MNGSRKETYPSEIFARGGGVCTSRKKAEERKSDENGGYITNRHGAAPLRTPLSGEQIGKFKVGMKVNHKIYGRGIILDVKDGNADVAFDAVGKKTLSLKIAPLEIFMTEKPETQKPRLSKCAKLRTRSTGGRENITCLDNPSVSDERYDALYDRLVRLEKDNGSSIGGLGSPLEKKEGGKGVCLRTLSASQKTVLAGQGSELRRVAGVGKQNRNVFRSVEFTVELKYDGLTINATYEDGKFVRAATRGNGGRGALP